MLPPYVFREYDIRALYGKDLFENDAYQLGQAFGTMVLETKETQVVVGRDGRVSSPSLSEALIQGLLDSGVSVYNVGVGPSPYLYFCEKNIPCGGAIMVTASHNPKNYNGFKFVFQGKSFFGQELQHLRKRMEEGKFKKGQGELLTASLKSVYIENLLQDFIIHYPNPNSLTVVWDPGNGASCEEVEALTAVLPGQHYVINGDMDGTFPNHEPDPTCLENCRQLFEKMQEVKADLGIGLDGDGDRVAIMDATGHLLAGDELLLLFAQEVLHHNPGAKIISEVKASQNFWQSIEAWGGEPIMGRTGHSLIKSLMLETRSPLAGEMSGHFFFADRYYGYDDGLYGAIRALGILSQAPYRLDQWRLQFPVFFTSPELRLPCDDKFQIIAKVKGQVVASYLSFTDIDGVRVTTNDGWWLLRVSNTQDALSARYEASTEEGLERIRLQMNSFLNPLHLDISKH